MEIVVPFVSAERRKVPQSSELAVRLVDQCSIFLTGRMNHRSHSDSPHQEHSCHSFTTIAHHHMPFIHNQKGDRNKWELVAQTLTKKPSQCPQANQTLACKGQIKERRVSRGQSKAPAKHMQASGMKFRTSSYLPLGHRSSPPLQIARTKKHAAGFTQSTKSSHRKTSSRKQTCKITENHPKITPNFNIICGEKRKGGRMWV